MPQCQRFSNSVTSTLIAFRTYRFWRNWAHGTLCPATWTLLFIPGHPGFCWESGRERTGRPPGPSNRKPGTKCHLLLKGGSRAQNTQVSRTLLAGTFNSGRPVVANLRWGSERPGCCFTLTKSNHWHKATAIKTVLYWHRNRHWPVEWSSEPKISPYISAQLISDKCTKSTQWISNSLFNRWCGDKWISTGKRIKLYFYPIPCTKINSKYITDLNRRAKTIKLLEKKCWIFITLDLAGEFLDRPTKPWKVNKKVHNLHHIKIF